MSSYRSYTPWKTSLGSSYKPGSSSYGTSGDSTSRYTSLATPSSYRPSFSGGTYRLKRDPPPSATTTPVSSYVSRYAKTEPKEAAPSERSSPVKRYTGNTTSSLGKYGRSRDPSPVALEHTNRTKSRDPSPVIDSARSKLGATYRGGNTPTTSSSSSSATRNAYSSRYGAGSRISGNGSALSYLTTSDFHARTASRAKASREREREKEKEKELEIEEKPSEASNGTDKSPAKQQEEQPENDEEPNETFITISVVTRATSPTLPGSTTVQRTRRIDPAKTIEKTIQRSTKRRETSDQEIQSDRLDDSTRYLRYSGGSSISSTYSPHRDRISSLRYSASPLSSSGSAKSSSVGEGKQIQPIPETVSPARTNGSVSSAKSSEALSPPRTNGSVSSAKSSEALSPPRTNGNVSSGKSSEALSPPRSNGFISSSKSIDAASPPKTNGSLSSSKSAKSKLSPPKAIRLNSRQSSVENLVNKPPAPPSKADSPTKTCSSSSGSSAVKWPNKDFRKSSLNVGPTDRPRKSRTPSSGGESEDLPNGSSLERSPSAGSEGSLASGSSSKKSSKLSNGKVPGSPRVKSHKSCSETTTGNSSSATASASDSEQQVKSVKKQAKKKTTNKEGGAGKVANAHKTNSTTESPPAVAEVVPATQTRLKKLSAVSNFFASRQQDANNEPIFLESSESSGEPEAHSLPVISALSGTSKISKISGISLTTDLRTNEPRTTPSSEAKPSPPTNSPSSSTRCPRETTTETGTRLPSSTTSTTQESSLTTTASLTTSEQDDPSWWQDTSLQINTASALDQNNRGEMPSYRLRHIDSGEEQAWWLRQDENGDDDDTLAEETLNTLDDDLQEPSKGTWWSQDDQDSSSQVKLMPRSRITPEKDAWWLQDEDEAQDSSRENGDLNNNNNTEPHVEVTLRLPSNGSQRSSKSSASKNGSNPKNGGSNPWWLSGPARKMFNVQRVESGERAWWQEEAEEPPQLEKENEPPPVKPPTPPPRIIKHWESGERAWWLQEDTETTQLPAQASSNDEEQPVMVVINQQESRDEVDLRLAPPTFESQELSNSFDFNAYSERPPPLGQCASPIRCASPYDNIPRSQLQEPPPPPPTRTSLQPRFSPQTRRAGEKLFISRHQNIDELLGGACRPLSPLFYGNTNHAEAELTPLAGKNMFLLEEVTPDQVRIHDSTAQLPVIQRMQRDVEWLENGSNFYEPPKQQQHQPPRRIDDAAIQVYKDGDYGAYLDLESSLAEQTEEIEGVNVSRKNSLVVRTQLNVRVHAIIEKLLSAQGSDLRRALFSLKQVFQEDKDLVHAFVALGGLNCLVRVGNCADQNYQNYILRALGQVMLYVDGMNGVMKHEPTMQWLYSLIASNYRSVVKTALKLLLVFVEYAESNCYVLVSAIHAVDASQGTLPWSNIMRLLKDYDNADAELVIYATSLINKTLAGLNDQDSFYDESDLLEQQGMETVIQRYMSKPGTDLDLLDQLQLYEAVLKFEDGESDGQRLPQNSMRKTQRYRPGTNTTERRKSRRHSTDNSPAPLTKVLPTTVLRMTPTQATVDEDSSGSTNSTEFSGGLFTEKKPRDGAGVTPGLRRRRERAERHKSFLKEQQEAAANGIFAALEQREGLGQIVTAIPATIQTGDSPPQSLQHEVPPCNNISSITNISNNNVSNLSCNDTPNNSLLVMSPSKQLLTGSHSISIINNSFDKASNNNQSEFLTKKNLFRERNSTVINGIMKNIQQTDSAYKKYENEANRLNNYYSQSPKHQIHQPIQPTPEVLLSPKKTLNASGFDFTPAPLSSTPVKCDVLPEPEPLSPVKKPVAAPPPPPPPPPPPGWWHAPIYNSPPARTLTSTNPELLPHPVDPTDMESEDKQLLLQLKRDHTVKDLTQKLSNLPMSPTQESANRALVGDMSGLISKAKEGLAKSKSKGEISRSSSVDQDIKKSEPKKSENELHWEELVRNMTRPLNLCDLDFTDLRDDDEKDVLAPRSLGAGIPPPPPPLGGAIAPPPMMPPSLAPPPMYGYGGSLTSSFNSLNGSINGELVNGNNTIKKNKKTVKLFWKEVREDMIPQVVGKTIWDELPDANVDTQKLEHLFESRAKDLMTKEKQQELNKSKEIIVLDHKRSNAINIAITKLPPPRAIKTAILKMDATVVTREGIDKLLNMLPTDEERGKIQEAQLSNPELPLGSAEQFLLTLASISELEARLKLWAFRLDFDNSEKEIAEPLMDLKQGIEILRQNRTFRSILSTLLSVGIFLNGAPVKGFQIEYLAKVPEVKDTVHKHSLLHHLCHMVMESSSDTSDLYSEIGPITRASKADFTDLAHNLNQLEAECKACWDRLKLIAKHDCPPPLKQKLVDFLADCAERIIILQIVHRRVMNRYRKFLLWLGMPQHSVAESRPNEFCRTLSEFALEYRTTRERVQQQLEKKANHRERNKTRGKLIIDMAKFKTKDDVADDELKKLLDTSSADQADGTLTWRRRRAEQLRSPITRQSEEQFTDGDDEILESLVKTATKAPGTRTTPRERKRTRHADRKSSRYVYNL
ncbi:uncharacterized protein LOC122618304 isoform X2 [Drosophila teissieri]|uniref:uncharacterized protein LOC122618304 isoform X2 n=1 Tax=Drosophila teissieri TaxID=7243 RepID=UPI001CB9F7B7|nr:uncharacterized protein LOC122618304 isoform X2 [Drosophila teissieri]